MKTPTIHQQVINLLISTDPIFKSFTRNDRVSLAGREAPPQTNADNQVAIYLSNELSKILPNHNIIVEDGEPILGIEDKSTWIVDPIDGTIPFMYHIPSYMISIYEINNNVIQSAYAYNPNNGDVFYSNANGSFCNELAMQVSTRDTLTEARIALSGYTIETLPTLYSRLRNEGAYVILQEGLVFRSTLVANAYLDATIQIGLKQFESGAVYSLVTNAGGKVISSTQDRINFRETSSNVVISNAKLSNKLVSIMQELVKGNTI